VSAMTNQAVIPVDADIMDLAEEFLRKRRQAVPRILAIIAANDMGELRRIGHELKGTAGSYGFDELSRAGAALEEAAVTEDAERARDTANRIAAFLQQVALVAR
jgi:HPt (histidine-containing phosphotransfer) domain-containing protein